MTNPLALAERWGWSRALLRQSGSRPRPTRRNWTFDVTLAVVLLIAVLVYALSSDFDLPDYNPPLGEIQSSGEPAEPQDHRDPVGPVDPADPADPDSTVVTPEPVYGPPPSPYDGKESLVVLLALLATMPLVFRRRFPLTVLWVALIAAAVTPSEMPWVTFYQCVIAAYSAAAYSSFRVATFVSMPVMFLAAGSLTGEELPTVPNGWAPLLVMVPITIAANGLRRWKLRTDDERERAETIRREQDEAVRRAAEHERARIARELHDVVTHNVSVMVIQAGAARKIMDTSPEQSREALLAVEAGGRAAMTELRHVMGLLTMGGDTDEPELAPQPGIGQLETLIGRVRDSGLPVDLTVSGEPQVLPSGIDLTAYRVVQEALTNTVKHAAGSRATVAIAYDPDEIRITVTDTGGEPGPAASSGNSRGLIGLRERLTLYGGTLDTTHRPTGGYRVEARIPLETT